MDLVIPTARVQPRASPLSQNANDLGTTVTAAGDFTYPTRGDLEKIPPSGEGGIWHNVPPNPNYKGREY